MLTRGGDSTATSSFAGLWASILGLPWLDLRSELESNLWLAAMLLRASMVEEATEWGLRSPDLTDTVLGLRT